MNQQKGQQIDNRVRQKDGIIRYFWITIGAISFVLGTAGIVLPLLPTVPFYMLTVFALARGSERFHRMFMESKFNRLYLEPFNREKALTLRHKLTIMAGVTVIMGTGVFAINHCEDGRIECKFDSGDYLYMGPGDMSVGWRIHDNYQHDSFFQTKQFRGVNLIVNVDKAQPVMDLLAPDSQIHLADIANRFCESSDFGMLIEETDSLK